MSKNFTAEDLINNLVDELERTQDMMRMMSEGKEIPSDFYEELQDDIYSDLDRFYDNKEEIREATGNIVIEEEKTPIFEFINNKFFCEDKIVPIAKLNAKSSSVDLLCDNKKNEFILCYRESEKNIFKTATLTREDAVGKTVKEHYGILADFFNKNADTEIPVNMFKFHQDGGILINYTDASTMSYDIKCLKDECERYLSEGFDKSALSEGNVVAQIDAMQRIYNSCVNGYFITQNTINKLADKMEYQTFKDYELYKEDWQKDHIDDQTRKETIASYRQSGLDKEISLIDYVENYGFANGCCYMSFEEFKLAEITEKILNNKKYIKTDIDRD